MNRKLKYLLIGGMVIGSLFPIYVSAEKVSVPIIVDGKECIQTTETKAGEFVSTSLDNAGKPIKVNIVESKDKITVGSQSGTTKEYLYYDQDGNPVVCLAAGKHYSSSSSYDNSLALQQQAWNLSGCTNSTQGNCAYGAISQISSALGQGLDMGGLSSSNYEGLSEAERLAALQQALRYLGHNRGINTGSGDRAESISKDAEAIDAGNYGSNYCGSNCGGNTANKIYSLAVDLYVAATKNGGVDMNGSGVTILWAKVGDSWQPFLTTEDVEQQPITDVDIDCPEDITCPLIPTGGIGECDAGGEANDPDMCAILAPVTSGVMCQAAWREEVKYTYMGSDSSTRAGGYFQHNVSGKSGSQLSTKVELTKQGTGVLDYEKWKEEYLTANMAVANAWTNMTMWWSIEVNNPSPRREPNGPSCGCTACGARTGDILYWDKPSPHGHCNASKYSVSCSIDTHTASDGSFASHSDYTPILSYEDGEPVYGECSTTSTTDGIPGDPDYVRKQKEAATNGYIGALNYRAKLLETLQDCYFMQAPEWYRGRSYETAMGGHSTSVNLKNYAETMNMIIPTSGFNLNYAHNGSDGANISTGVTTAGPEEDSIVHSDALKEDLCNGCSGNLDELGGAGTDTIPFYYCSGGYTGTCVNEPITVSKSSTTTMKAKAEIGIYQSASFSTKIYSGELTNNGGGVGYLSLPDRSWPVPATAPSGSYPSMSTVPNLGSKGQFAGGTIVCPYNVTNELTKFDCDYDYHVCYDCTGSEECYPDGGPKVGLGVYFRAIDLNDVFPESKFSPQNENSLTGVTRRIGSNWSTSNAVQVIKEIQDLNDQVWFEKPQYTVTLSPAARAQIKKYNKNNKYLDYSIKCDGFNCSSKFLETELKEILGEKYGDFYTKDRTIPSSALYNYKK